MATLAANKGRFYENNADPVFNDLPVVASDIIYEGAAVGDASGLARPLVGASDAFVGFCDRICDNSAGAASAKNVRVRERGRVQLAVAAGGVGAGTVDDLGLPVYATDDDTFTFLNTGAQAIGKVARWVSTGVYIVQFEAVQQRSI